MINTAQLVELFTNLNKTLSTSKSEANLQKFLAWLRGTYGVSWYDIPQTAYATILGSVQSTPGEIMAFNNGQTQGRGPSVPMVPPMDDLPF